MNTHTHPHVFVTTEGEHPRRSNFSRRAMRPATDGNLDRVEPRIRTQPVKPGLTFHGLRHSHKTWLIDAGVPEIAQARRLGHALDDDIQDIYSHVSQQVEQALINAALAENSSALVGGNERGAWTLTMAAAGGAWCTG
ncbi:tyrosine-type recombinase/integrase [Saccharopolyspora shandongensis]|uniref:tyrosine-type recombinase/integrase n=1 Tax=Saccharopolyspora shandongensis TaxID=418495 RepID=UPI0033F05D19